MIRVQIRDLLGTDVLAGSRTGRRALGLLLDRFDRQPEEPERAGRVYLDFSGINVATASFLRECVLEFRDTVRKRWSHYYPIVANPNHTVTEELAVLVAERDVLLLCTLGEGGTPRSLRLLGTLRPKQKMTLDLVKKLGETDAGELSRISKGSENVGRTAWNNRLASLSRLGLLIEVSQGKRKRYLPLVLES